MPTRPGSARTKTTRWRAKPAATLAEDHPGRRANLPTRALACTLAWRAPWHGDTFETQLENRMCMLDRYMLDGLPVLTCWPAARLLQRGPKAGDVRKCGLCSLRVVRPSGPHCSEEEKATGSAEPSDGASLIVVARVCRASSGPDRSQTCTHPAWPSPLVLCFLSESVMTHRVSHVGITLPSLQESPRHIPCPMHQVIFHA